MKVSFQLAELTLLACSDLVHNQQQINFSTEQLIEKMVEDAEKLGADDTAENNSQDGSVTGSENGEQAKQKVVKKVKVYSCSCQQLMKCYFTDHGEENGQ